MTVDKGLQKVELGPERRLDGKVAKGITLTSYVDWGNVSGGGIKSMGKKHKDKSKRANIQIIR